MAGMLSKAMRSASEAGAAVSLENFKADILRKRDERLQGYQESMQSREFEHSDKQQAESRAAAEASELRGIAERSQARVQDQENEERRLDIAEQGLEMDRERLDLTAQQIQQELDKGEFGLIEAQRLQGIHDVIINPDSSQEQVSTAVQMLRNMQGAEPQKYEFIKISGDGFSPDQIFRGNPGTGEGGIMNLTGDSPSGSGYNSPEDVRAAYRNGDITREEAAQILQSGF